jgi:DNA-binding MarR family transcriptional regulator
MPPPPPDPAQPARQQPAPERSPRLGYLLKHAHQRFAGLTSAALAPLGIDTREWATLICIDDAHPRSQLELAEAVGVDRTTMVALIDQLQAKGLIARRIHPGDRRKNVIELTSAGRDIRRRAADRVDECERRFLAPLGVSEAEQLKSTLAALVTPER